QYLLFSVSFLAVLYLFIYLYTATSTHIIYLTFNNTASFLDSASVSFAAISETIIMNKILEYSEITLLVSIFFLAALIFLSNEQHITTNLMLKVFICLFLMIHCCYATRLLSPSVTIALSSLLFKWSLARAVGLGYLSPLGVFCSHPKSWRLGFVSAYRDGGGNVLMLEVVFGFSCRWSSWLRVWIFIHLTLRLEICIGCSASLAILICLPSCGVVVVAAYLPTGVRAVAKIDSVRSPSSVPSSVYL
ncbi:hypothetical protein L9F63_017896, partial [Diploptera punctata]